LSAGTLEERAPHSESEGGENRGCAFKAHENSCYSATVGNCMILHLPNNVHN